MMVLPYYFIADVWGNPGDHKTVPNSNLRQMRQTHDYQLLLVSSRLAMVLEFGYTRRGRQSLLYKNFE